MKKSLSILLVLAMLLCALPLTAGAVIAKGDSPVAIPQNENIDLASTGAAADELAPTGEAMRITKQPAEKLYISKYNEGDTHPIYPYIVFGVAGGTGVYTFDWYYCGDDEYAIGEKIASTAGPVYQPTQPGYYHCWVYDSSGDSVFCNRTLVRQESHAPEIKGRISGTKLEWYESEATALRSATYEIQVVRKDTTHNDYRGMYYLTIDAGLDGSIVNFYGYNDYSVPIDNAKKAAFDPTYDAAKHLYSLNIDPALTGNTQYDDYEYEFRIFETRYKADTLIMSGYFPVKKLHEGLIVKYFPTDLWREGEVRINDGEYTPGTVLRPNLTCGRWAGQESKVKVFLQEYYMTDWIDVQEVSGSYTVKTEDVGKRLRFKISPKNPYERYVGELYWEKEAFYSNAISVTKSTKYISGTVNCTFTEPRAGVKANTAISFTDTNSKKYYTLSADTASKTGLDWYFSNGQIANNYAFDGGSAYTADVYFELINQDSAYNYNYDGLKVYFNGKEATVKRQGMKYLEAKLSYTLPDVDVIDRTVINVTKPVAGSYPTFSATAIGAAGWNVESSYSMGYYQNGVLWRNLTDDYYMTSKTSDPSNRFEKGKRYQVTVSLVVTSKFYVFAEKSLVTGVVNQNYATVGDYNDGNEGQNIYLEYTFDLDDVIRTMSFTVSEPAEGGKPSWSAEIPSDARYSLGGLSSTADWEEDGWSMMRSDTFKAGKNYTVKILVKADDDCRFIDETVAYINGRTATITEKWTNSYGESHARVEYTFTLGGGGIRGDVDNNSRVDIFDASSIQKSLAGAAGYADYSALDKSSVEFRAADVDGNGKVDIFDASLIQKYLAGDASAQKYGIGQTI